MEGTMDTVTLPQQSTGFPLPQADLDSLGFRKSQIERLIVLIEKHIAEGRYPGCQIALARHGKLALYKTFGHAATEPAKRAAADDTLWLLYSNTKVVTAVGAGRAWPVRFLRQDRRSRAGVREVRQGQHHRPADHHAPG